jgi:hypothetical protein
VHASCTCACHQQEKYLQGRSERMARILQEAAAVAAAMAAVSQQPGGTAAAGSSSTVAAPAGVESPEAWGFAANGTSPSLPRFVKALDERLINTMQETVMNVNGIFLQVCVHAVIKAGGSTTAWKVTTCIKSMLDTAGAGGKKCCPVPAPVFGMLHTSPDHGRCDCIVLQGDQSAARRKPLLAMAKDIIGEYFKLIR